MSVKTKISKQTGMATSKRLKRASPTMIYSVRLKHEELNELRELGIAIAPLVSQAIANAIKHKTCPCCGHRVTRSVQALATHKLEEYGITKNDLK